MRHVGQEQEGHKRQRWYGRSRGRPVRTALLVQEEQRGQKGSADAHLFKRSAGRAAGGEERSVFHTCEHWWAPVPKLPHPLRRRPAPCTLYAQPPHTHPRPPHSRRSVSCVPRRRRRGAATSGGRGLPGGPPPAPVVTEGIINESEGRAGDPKLRTVCRRSWRCRIGRLELSESLPCTRTLMLMAAQSMLAGCWAKAVARAVYFMR